MSEASPEPSLRLILTRALLTNEWADSVEARLSEASSVLDLPAPYARALLEANVESWFTDIWSTWGFDAAAALAPLVTDPRLTPTDASPQGFPFTPPDVVEQTVRWLSGIESGGPPRILSLADGTGALVAGLVSTLLAGGKHSPDDLIGGLRIVDEDPIRLDIACVIVARAFEQSLSEPPQDVLARVRSAAQCGDAVTWAGSTDERFDLLVGVAPFGDRGTDSGNQTDNLAGLYLRALADVVVDGGAGAVIAPSFIVTATTGSMADVRDRLLDRFKTAEFLNYDLTAEPLLGPADWASRTIVRVHASGTGKVTTTPMMRWSPDRRSTALTNPPTTTLFQPPPMWKHSFVPRIGSDAERRLVDAVIAHQTSRWDRIQVSRTHGDYRDDNDVFSVGPTVRGHFSIALSSPRIYFGEAPSGGARFGVKSLEPEFTDPALAVMLSRTALWWWLATSDGQHVRQEHITEPLSWLRLLSPAELGLGNDIANAWREEASALRSREAGSVAARDAALSRSRLTAEFERTLLSSLGTSESDAQDLLSRTNFVNV